VFGVELGCLRKRTSAAKAARMAGSDGTAEQVAEKVEMLISAPKGAIDSTRLAASLKRCPDTKPSFSATSEAVPYPKQSGENLSGDFPGMGESNERNEDIVR